MFSCGMWLFIGIYDTLVTAFRPIFFRLVILPVLYVLNAGFTMVLRIQFDLIFGQWIKKRRKKLVLVFRISNTENRMVFRFIICISSLIYHSGFEL